MSEILHTQAPPAPTVDLRFENTEACTALATENENLRSELAAVSAELDAQRKRNNLLTKRHAVTAGYVRLAIVASGIFNLTDKSRAICRQSQGRNLQRKTNLPNFRTH